MKSACSPRTDSTGGDRPARQIHPRARGRRASGARGRGAREEALGHPAQDPGGEGGFRGQARRARS